MDSMVAQIMGDKTVKHVVLADGTRLEADLVIVGTGVKPSTAFTENTGIELDTQGAIVCDQYLQTRVPDIFAAGDNVSYPYHILNRNLRIEHYITAMD